MSKKIKNSIKITTKEYKIKKVDAKVDIKDQKDFIKKHTIAKAKIDEKDET